MNETLIAELKFEPTAIRTLPGFRIVYAHGFYYLNIFFDLIAGRGFTLRRWLTANAAFRHLAKQINPK